MSTFIVFTMILQCSIPSIDCFMFNLITCYPIGDACRWSHCFSGFTVSSFDFCWLKFLEFVLSLSSLSKYHCWNLQTRHHRASAYINISRKILEVCSHMVCTPHSFSILIVAETNFTFRCINFLVCQRIFCMSLVRIRWTQGSQSLVVVICRIKVSWIIFRLYL